VIVEIENTVQENELNTEKAGLLGFLRTTLNNYSIQLKYNKVAVKEQTNYYTNRDRFNRLVELNPTLLELKKRFNLETDY
ncbi:MAG: DNA polymerase-3 subunit gamma/tau, partial [Salibacteraceae bacterium]